MIKKYFNKILIAIGVCLMLVLGVTISIDRATSVYADNNPISPYNIIYTNNWLSYTSNFSFSATSNYCWTDGSNTFYSYNGDNYVLNTTTLTWTTKVWNGLSNFDGSCVWTDGVNTFYSLNGNNYVLDILTSTWTTKTWVGFTSFYGARVWTDGSNIYYSYNGDNYVLDILTSTWTAKTWIGLTNFSGDNVWTDGTYFYYSDTNSHYVLDITTSTWTTKTWIGLTSFYGARVWTDGTNIFNSSRNDGSYLLDIINSTWSSYSFTGLTSFNGAHVFSFNDIIIIPNANSSSWYMLEKDTSGGNSGGGNETDTYYHFTGSNYIMFGNSSASYDNAYFVNGYFDIEDVSNQNYDFVVSFKYYKYELRLISSEMVSESFDLWTLSLNLDFNTSYTNETTNFANILYLRVSTSGWTNSDIIGCTISSELDVDANDNTYYYIVYTFNYFNSSNEHLICNYVVHTPRDLLDMQSNLLNNYVLFSTRTYYFSSSSSGNGDFESGYNQGFQEGQEYGYNNGYNAGQTYSYNEGYSDGYDIGSSSGYDLGYDEGYLDGSSDNNDYTLFALISATVDAPLQAITNLFNFNLFGFNLLNLFTGLLTLVVLIAILRFLMGGK